MSASAAPYADDPLREHRALERTPWIAYAVLAASVALLAAAAIGGSETWRAMALAAGGLLGAGSVARMWHRHESGCRVDREGRVIVWWSGPQPATERRIAVDAVRVARVETSAGVARLVLEDHDGEPIALPGECVPPDARGWAEALARAFPHVAVVLRPTG